ncbi:type VI secretion system Vgr family protein [Cognatilysobacter bugurensis]|uniref:Type VI secretion system tip protein VgrG n=1 Tax=Cognatilysobacter bugurensis TaxID=543356 RepID=A0A918T0K7_9GAMM|nr:type VI secretion system Vgr family protein [Lysobacter bugurensis]GHA82291.1 hypothetical protein GCM10007067_20300 [Lysobacter bugurensis]
MADPYSPFTLGDAANAIAADPELAPLAPATALADELLRLIRNGGDRTALAEELLAMARGHVPAITRAMPAEQAMAAAIDYERVLGKLAPLAPLVAGTLRALHRGRDRRAVAAQLASAPADVLMPDAAQARASGSRGLATPPFGADSLPSGAASARDVASVASKAGGVAGVAHVGAAAGLARSGNARGPADRRAPVSYAATERHAGASLLAQSLIGRLSGEPRLLEIDTALPGAFLVERYTGTEAVCAPFKFEIDCLSVSAFLDTRVLLGQSVTLRQRCVDQAWRHWHGLCTQVAPLGGDGGYARYRLTVEPWTALLALRRNALIFQDHDVRGVLEQVFADYPQADWRIDVTQPLPTRAVTTQYRETDWAFVARLLADAGLAWRFEHRQGASADDARLHTLVVFDRQAERPSARPDTLRFHRSNASERQDAITAFTQQRQMTPDAVVVGSWQAERVEAVAGTAELAPAGPNLPRREVYGMPRAGRFTDEAHVRQAAELQLDALRVSQSLHAGGGTGRGLEAGAAFTLVGHPELDGQRFVPVAIEHVATNNLGTGIVAILDDVELERGSYRNRFLAVPADTALVPAAQTRPLAPGAQTARVVGLPDAAVTGNRDHQVRIQFPWQRGRAPNPGGLADTGSRSNPEGHAPGDHTSGTWVRVAEWLAGPNWGSHALPRIGSEVLVEFLHGDIDQPVVTGQLYNGEVAPPFALTDASNHPGTLSGLHTQSLDGSGTQQWVIDDAPGQLRQRLHTSIADSRLELGYLIEHHNGQRGALRGQGFDLATLGWANLRAGQGVLLSTTARSRAQSTQFDVAEAVSQLKAAQDTAQALSDAASQHDVAGLAANEQQDAFIRQIDAEQDGRYTGPVGGQAAAKPTGSARDGGDPVERFASPVLLAESPDTIVMTTPASALAFAGNNLHLTSQGDAHIAAGQTWSAVSGRHAALLAQTGPIRVIAANGPMSLQAHTGALELLADQSVTITATDDRIDVLAKEKIVLQAGQTQITLEGGDITFACPGTFTVKASQHPFSGGASASAALDTLPDGLTDQAIELLYTYRNLAPVQGAPFKLVFANGQTISGTLDEEGRARIENAPGHAVKVEYGEDRRTTPEPFIEPLANPIFGTAPSTAEEAHRLLEQYAAAERAFLEDYFFDDEIEEMQSQEWNAYAHDAYQDYRLDGEHDIATSDYRAEHPEQTQDKESLA